MSDRKKSVDIANGIIRIVPFESTKKAAGYIGEFKGAHLNSQMSAHDLVQAYFFTSNLYYDRILRLDVRTHLQILQYYEYPTIAKKVTKIEELAALDTYSRDELLALFKTGKVHRVTFFVVDPFSDLCLGRGEFLAPLTDRPYKKTGVSKQFGSPTNYMDLLEPCFDKSFTFQSIVDAKFTSGDLFPHLMSSVLGVAYSTIESWQSYKQPKPLTDKQHYERYVETRNKDLFLDYERSKIRNYYVAKMVSECLYIYLK